LLATSQIISAFPHSVLKLYGRRFASKVLPLELLVRSWLVAILALRHRTLAPAVERFINAITSEIARTRVEGPMSPATTVTWLSRPVLRMVVRTAENAEIRTPRSITTKSD